MKRVTAILILLALVLCVGAAAPVLYPVQVIEAENGEHLRMEKIYHLSADDDPAMIPMGDFTREGYHYICVDLLRRDMTERDSRAHTELVTLTTKTKDMEKFFPLLAPALDVTTEDGYSGTLTLDQTGIDVKATEYGTTSRAVTATRSYPNLSDADLALVPKTITENGRTMELVGVDWQEAAAEQAATCYTAHATYSTTVSTRYESGYTVTAPYAGTVEKVVSDTVVYTAIFSGTKIAPPPAPTWELPTKQLILFTGIALTVVLVVGIVCTLWSKKRRRGV